MWSNCFPFAGKQLLSFQGRAISCASCKVLRRLSSGSDCIRVCMYLSCTVRTSLLAGLAGSAGIPGVQGECPCQCNSARILLPPFFIKMAYLILLRNSFAAVPPCHLSSWSCRMVRECTVPHRLSCLCVLLCSLSSGPSPCHSSGHICLSARGGRTLLSVRIRIQVLS